VSSSVAKSSGDAAIDKRAVEVLASAAPFPPMPQGLTDDSLSFTVPLRFK
jgi:TonB family protein